MAIITHKQPGVSPAPKASANQKGQPPEERDRVTTIAFYVLMGLLIVNLLYFILLPFFL